MAARIGILDIPALIARMNGDEALLHEIAGMFLDLLPSELTPLRSAVAAGDREAIRKSAHRLRGSLSNFGAEGAVEALRALEALSGGTADIGSAPALLRRFENELGLVTPELRALAGEPARG